MLLLILEFVWILGGSESFLYLSACIRVKLPIPDRSVFGGMRCQSRRLERCLIAGFSQSIQETLSLNPFGQSGARSEVPRYPCQEIFCDLKVLLL